LLRVVYCVCNSLAHQTAVYTATLQYTYCKTRTVLYTVYSVLYTVWLYGSCMM
jgi:hypothetical protein